MLKKCVFAALVLTMLLLSFCTVFADQDGNNCWCNIDDHGCWNTGEDGGKSYIMFWSEESRQYIMGTGSAPYKFVVEKPGSSNILGMKCGSPAPVVIPPAASGTAASGTPANACSNFIFQDCEDACENNLQSCQLACRDDVNCRNLNLCFNKLRDCTAQCENQYNYCNNK